MEIAFRNVIICKLPKVGQSSISTTNKNSTCKQKRYPGISILYFFCFFYCIFIKAHIRPFVSSYDWVIKTRTDKIFI